MLAIGLVVDDAIVVVEGVERHIEEGMTPKDAALQAMEELSGPVVGIASAFSPFRCVCAHRSVHFRHHRGGFWQQFARNDRAILQCCFRLSMR